MTRRGVVSAYLLDPSTLAAVFILGLIVGFLISVRHTNRLAKQIARNYGRSQLDSNKVSYATATIDILRLDPDQLAGLRRRIIEATSQQIEELDVSGENIPDIIYQTHVDWQLVVRDMGRKYS
jgi:hypothetical protein